MAVDPDLSGWSANVRIRTAVIRAAYAKGLHHVPGELATALVGPGNMHQYLRNRHGRKRLRRNHPAADAFLALFEIHRGGIALPQRWSTDAGLAKIRQLARAVVAEQSTDVVRAFRADYDAIVAACDAQIDARICAGTFDETNDRVPVPS